MDSIAKKIILFFTMTAIIFSSNTGFSKDAIVLLTFGTRTNAFATYKYVEEKFRQHFAEYDIYWAYSSNIIRNKTKNKKLYSLKERLKQIGEKGYNKAFVQPLFIFPAYEYKLLLNNCKDVHNVKVFVSTPLIKDSKDVPQTLKAIENYFIADGLNIIAGHGTNDHLGNFKDIYTDFASIVENNYNNVALITVEGWPGRTQLNNLAGKHTFKKALIIPFMFVAGDHIINDINGRKNSLKKELTKKFDSVETLTYSYDNKTYYMGLGFNEKVVNIFVQKLQKLIEETDD